MLTQIVLLKDFAVAANAVEIPGVSEVHRIEDGRAYGAVLVLRGPSTEFLAGTLEKLNAKEALVLPVETSMAALDPKYLP